MYNAPGTMLALRPDRVPGQVKALMGFRTPPAGLYRRDLAAQRALLTRTFTGTGWVADQVVADLQDSTDLVVEELGQARMDSWSSGRVVLLGDAAWCARRRSPASAPAPRWSARTCWPGSWRAPEAITAQRSPPTRT
jgi:2-polyprenyl-6-methoxyphenol hydroxylase-like FAD-dependent oxidoreductase